MAQDQLREFFHDKKLKAKSVNIDWSARRKAWVKVVKDFFRTIVDDYLKAAKTDVDISYLDKVVTENAVGQYVVPELVLSVGDEQVVFSPKGINIVGALGRIDVLGDRGEATIVWQDEDRWSIVVSRTPTLRLIPLSADSLADVLKGVMRP